MTSARPLLVDASLRFQVGYPGEQEPETRARLPASVDPQDPQKVAELVAAQASEESETLFVCVSPTAFARAFCEDLCVRLFERLPRLERVFVQPRSALALIGLGLRNGAYADPERGGCATVANGLQFGWTNSLELSQLPMIEVQTLGLQTVAVERPEQEGPGESGEAEKSERPALAGARWVRQQVWVGDAEVWTGMAAVSALRGFCDACVDRGLLGPGGREQLGRLGL